MIIRNSLLLFAILICFISCGKKKILSSNPNIIFILLDDLGYGDFSIYAPDNKIKTPNIDNLALDGMKFTDAHSSSSVCTPTRYGLLTGRYNWRTRLKSGVLTGSSKALIPNSRTTVASILKAKGYNTAVIGKWHLGWDWSLKDTSNALGSGWNPTDFSNIDFTKPVHNNPNDLGFDYFYCHAGSLDMAPYVYIENGIPTDIVDTVTVNTGKYSWWREGPTARDFDHEEVTPTFFNKANHFIENQSESENPFFLYLALPSPHTPILPTEEWQGKSNLNPYADFTMMIDHYIGSLMQTIQDKGIEENTLIILSSDNGCSPAAGFDEMVAIGHLPNGEFRGHKADIFEGGHRVPFIAKWPAKIKAGSTSAKTICLTDFMSTCADIVDYKLQDDEGEDSFSFMSVLNQDETQEYKRPTTVHHSINGSFAIRKDDWKLIMCPGSGGWSNPRPNDTVALQSLPLFQLYNLSDDPSESQNLLAEYPEKAEALKSNLIKIIKSGRSTPGSIQNNDEIQGEWSQIDFLR